MPPNSDQFVDTIRNLIPINGLPARHQNEVIQRGKVVKIRKGRYVFKQGDRDDFSFYLLEGDLELMANGQLVKQMSGGNADARHALAQLQPRQLSARAKSPIQVFKVDQVLLDRLLADDRFVDGGSEVQVAELEDEQESEDWMTRMLGSDLFSRLPAANIQSVFTRMEAVEMHAGDVVVEQGAPGDYYYIIQSGRCLVTRRSPGNGGTTKLAELKEGDSFGEEALVSESKRNATVAMLSDGQLMRLAKRDFNELIKKPTLTSVTYSQATKMVGEGALWLDVRFPDEHKATGIQGSRNLPLNQLRAKMAELDPEKRYVVYCDSGGRSSAGAFLLAQRGYDACYLAGGLNHSPIRAPEPGGRCRAKHPKTRTEAPVRQQIPAAPTSAGPRSAPLRRPSPVAATPAAKDGAQARTSQALERELAAVKRQLEEALRSKSEAESARAAAERAVSARQDAGSKQRLEAELGKTTRQLEEVQRLRDEAEGRLRDEKARLEARTKETERRLADAVRQKDEAESARRAAEAAMEDSLRSSRKRHESKARDRRAEDELERLKQEVETARRAAEADRRHRQEREQELQTLRRDTEQRLQAEEQRLEAEQERYQRELASLQRLKEQAEAEIRREREAVRQSSEDAAKRLEEARRLEQELAVARNQSERSVERKREELRAIEQRLREDEKTMMERVNQTLAEERRKLEAELAGSREALARAQRQAREAAAAERRAAEKEAERVIAEYKEAHEMVLADELAKLKSERAQLEAEGERAKRALAEAQRLRREAEDSHRAAQKEIDGLRAAHQRAVREQSKLAERIASHEQEADRVSEELQAVERMSEVAEAAREASEAGLARQRQEEDRLREQIADDKQRVISPTKLAELKRQREQLERAMAGSRKAGGGDR